ncbi:MAG: 4'-phosphopantetheinyl transferase superfamily protein [Solirubrobacteraceae bacterium]
MIEEILPADVVSVEAREDTTDARLFPEEQLVVSRAVDKRRREFTTARMCARAALEKLGLPAVPIPCGERGEPLWPAGVVGSITHCESYRACAVAQSSKLVTVGIDAEPNAALPDGLLGDIARPEELPMLRQLELESSEVHWDRLLFSAKESIYKAWFPLARRWLGFEDAVVAVDPSAAMFKARLLVPGPLLAGGPLRGFSGSWMVRDGIILTAIAVSIG